MLVTTIARDLFDDRLLRPNATAECRGRRRNVLFLFKVEERARGDADDDMPIG
jgi:hypothetical protein